MALNNSISHTILKRLLPLVALLLIPTGCRISYKLNGSALDYTVYLSLIHI